MNVCGAAVERVESVLQCVAVCCSVLQRVAVYYSVLLYILSSGVYDYLRSDIVDECVWCGRWVHWECVAVCGSVWQCVAFYYSMLQCVQCIIIYTSHRHLWLLPIRHSRWMCVVRPLSALRVCCSVCGSVLQCTAACCSVLQCLIICTPCRH